MALATSETGRVLPSREVSRTTIGQAYTQFVLFCNPAYDAGVDTADLEDMFSAPPSSNKQNFQVFDIFAQVKRLHQLEIRTWQQLATDLGVRIIDDVQASSQRVPQYVVRLRRWMKQAHVDAFFDYLLGKPNDYYTHVPPLDNPHPPDGRCGVLALDDLVLRALDPSLRPKRGRKRTQEAMDDLPLAQKHSLDNVRIESRPPLSAIPSSAHPGSAIATSSKWSSMSTTNSPPSDAAPDNFRFVYSPAVETGKRPQGKQKLQVQVPEHKGGPIRLMTPVVSRHMDTPHSSDPLSTIVDPSSSSDFPESTEEGFWRRRCVQLQAENNQLKAKLTAVKAQLKQITDAL